MAMNYCPNCGHQLDKNEKFCPNCGTPLEDEKEEVRVDDGPFSMTPHHEESNWIDKWNDRATANKVGILALFFVVAPVCIIPLVKSVIEMKDSLSYMWPLIIVDALIIIGIIAAFVCVIKRKNIIKEIDGYTVLVFITTSQHALIVEGEMQDSQSIYNSRYHHTRPVNLHGHLPNGRKIYVDFENHVHGIEIKFED